jgi:hypothetical protein
MDCRLNSYGLKYTRLALQGRRTNGRSISEPHALHASPAGVHSYQLFERCANDLSVIRADRASPPRVAVPKQHL